ncbi:MAG: hypothetical protein GC191_14830 [Azospirillum sp.]|nr:hypothetical protein [Azospirillum sp.]
MRSRIISRLEFVSCKDREAVAAAIEALNAKLHRTARASEDFPTDEAALKLRFLVMNRAEKAWTRPARQWGMAKAQLAIPFGACFTRAMT